MLKFRSISPLNPATNHRRVLKHIGCRRQLMTLAIETSWYVTLEIHREHGERKGCGKVAIPYQRAILAEKRYPH